MFESEDVVESISDPSVQLPDDSSSSDVSLSVWNPDDDSSMEFSRCCSSDGSLSLVGCGRGSFALVSISNIGLMSFAIRSIDCSMSFAASGVFCFFFGFGCG